MSVQVELSEETIDQLRAEAARRDIAVEELIAELASQLPARKLGPRSAPDFFPLGRSNTGRNAADADEMLDEGFGQD